MAKTIARKRPAKTTVVKKRHNPPDVGYRHVRASHRRDDALDRRIDQLELNQQWIAETLAEHKRRLDKVAPITPV